MRVRRSSPGHRSRTSGGWKTCRTPCTTIGRSMPRTLMMTLARNLSAPRISSRPSKQASRAMGSIGSSKTRHDARIRPCRLTSCMCGTFDSGEFVASVANHVSSFACLRPATTGRPGKNQSNAASPSLTRESGASGARSRSRPMSSSGIPSEDRRSGSLAVNCSRTRARIRTDSLRAPPRNAAPVSLCACPRCSAGGGRITWCRRGDRCRSCRNAH